MRARPVVLAVLLGLGSAGSTGCGQVVPQKSVVIDLLHDHDLAAARKQPEGAVRKEIVAIDGTPTPSLVMPAPSRVTWPVRFSERVELDASVALRTEATAAPMGVTLRIGLSDDRWYNEVLRLKIDPPPAGSGSHWQPIKVDLSPFSGWKWSLFYRPSRVAWKLIVNADAAPGGTLAWRQFVVQPR